MNWSVLGPAAVIAIAILVFIGYLVLRPSSNSTASGSPTYGGGPRFGAVQCGNNTMSVTYHVHAHISVFNKGKPEVIGQDFGHYYNGDCLYWIHAHDTQGIIHIESPSVVVPTLKNWYGVEKQTLDPSQVVSLAAPKGEQRKVWLNMQPYLGDPYAIKLHNHTDVTVEFGPPWVKPTRFNFAAHQV